MSGPCSIITITGNFCDAYECEREAVEQADHALKPDEARLGFEIKSRMSSGTTWCALSSPEHQTLCMSPRWVYLPPCSCSLPHQQLRCPRMDPRTSSRRGKMAIRLRLEMIGTRSEESKTLRIKLGAISSMLSRNRPNYKSTSIKTITEVIKFSHLNLYNSSSPMK
jgi:hypothetical protein